MAGMMLQEGGVVRALLDLCAALAARGHQVTLLTLDAPDVPRDWMTGAPDRPRVELIGRRPGPLPMLRGDSLRRVDAILAESDVLHLHVPWDPLCLRIARLARRRGVPYVVSLHGMLDDWCMAHGLLKKRVYLAAGGRAFLERAHAVHCTARAEMDQSQRWYPAGRSAVVPLIFDLAPFRDLPGPDLARRSFPGALDGDPVFLFVGRLHPIKHIELLIESAARLRDEGAAGRVLVAGSGAPGYERDLRRLVEDRRLGDRVRFLGFVTGPVKASLYQAADVFVLPSHHESWGFVALEALACATPVITTRACNIWPELEASGGAVIVERSPAALATALRRLAADPAARSAMTRGGRDWVMQSFDADRVTVRYEELYRAAAE
jgi:glycosyltransferase involved in cell wall biosynthesis